MSINKENKGIPPEKLILRCYACKNGDKKWHAMCLDINLAIEADSLQEIREKMNNVIISYIDTVLDTQDKDSIPALLFRPAPLRDWLFYYYLKSLYFIIKELPQKILFKEFIPFHLAHNC